MRRWSPLFAVVVGALVVAALVWLLRGPSVSSPLSDGGGQWLNHSGNGSTIPSDDPAHPSGPSTVIRGIRERAAARQAAARRDQALGIEHALHGQPSDAASP